MAKKKFQQHFKPKAQEANNSMDSKSGNSLKDLLKDDMLTKLKSIEKDLKQAKEKEAQEEAERLRKEKEEREKNKSFAELLDEFDKKSGGKYV